MNLNHDDRGPAARWRKALQSWLVPTIVLALGITAIVAVHAGLLRFTAKPSRDFLVILVTTEVAFVVWVRALSQMRLRRQITTLVAFFSLQIALHQSVRLDGFAGDGRPLWTWRWNPTPQAAFERAHRERAEPATGRRVDLVRTTDFDSPGFRGGERTGQAPALPLAIDWKFNPPRRLWKQPIGSGWSSFAIVGEYCVTQEQRGDDEATVCYELRAGREQWAHRERARFYEATGGEGPRATPTIHGGRVYSLGATGILNCLDGASGQRIWAVNILDDNHAANRLFGVTGSPLVAGSLVIVNPGGQGSSLAAYDLETGERIWRAGDAGASYSSPQAARLNGVEQVLDFNAEGLFAHDLSSGDVLWSVPWISNPAERNNVCQPVAVPGQSDQSDCVFISSGYGMGCALFEVRRRGNGLEAVERWRNRNLKAKFSSVVTHEGYVFGMDDAILTCVQISSGKRQWKGGHYGFGQLILAGSLLLVQLESGEIALVEASPQAYRELGRIDALSDRTWNHPALAGRLLVVRNDREAACYELPVQQEEPAIPPP